MWDQATAQFIADALAMLNKGPTGHGDYYLDVTLRIADGTGGGEVVGTFSDEIAADCWTFEFKADA